MKLKADNLAASVRRGDGDSAVNRSAATISTAPRIIFHMSDASLTRLLEKEPLYASVRVSAWAYNNPMLSPPPEIELHCDSCGKLQSWRIVPDQSRKPNEDVHVPVNYGRTDLIITYRCKNCPDKKPVTTSFALKVQSVSSNPHSLALEIVKFGQFPAQESVVAPELKRHFDSEGLDLYRKALRSRNFGYALGALAYLRRVVEDSMSDLLILIRADPANGGRVSEIEEAAKSRTFDDKVRFAAEILPPRLVREGQNPVERLHHWSSAGIHRMSESECLIVFDKLRSVFEMLFISLENERQNDRRWRLAMNELVSREPDVGGEEG